jgi:protein tyrosine phosphatase (PTP) superfamily phosphohydrolase (DUF442 family)
VFAFPLGYLAWSQATANFATIVPERVYRSGQMSARKLDRTIRAHGIKTVLNLRGINPGQAWYRTERATTLADGATQVDISMASCQWMSRAQLKVLAHTLETAERPLLIHCAWGSERTGLASAFAELLRPGSTLADARYQFSIRYLFVRAGDGAIMAEHLDQYAAWLRKQGVAHSPDQFRRWVAEGFQPGTPSREQWPYDPYPLIVVTRPAPARQGGDESKLSRAGDPRRTAPR